MVRYNEEVDSDVDHIDDHAVVIHLCKGAEKDHNIEDFVDALHWVEKAVHDCKDEMDKTDDYQNILM